MAIGDAVQQDGMVHVYAERGYFKFSKSGELHEYTGSTVSVRVGGVVHTYDENGHFKFSKAAG